MISIASELMDNVRKGVWTRRRRRFLLVFMMLSILGAWLNAQGGWVKDFSYHRVVVLPLLFENFTTTGFQWYLAGIFDDILGVTANLIGIYGFKKLSNLEALDVYGKKYFIIPLTIYLIADFAAFLNFNNYYTGVTDLTTYGEYWNMFQYFALIPSFILTDVFLLMYRTGQR